MGKRILLIANEYTTIVNFRMELLQALISMGHIVAVALPEHQRNEEIRAVGCQVITLPVDRKGKNPIKDLFIIKHILNIINTFKPDISFSFTIKPNIYGGIACSLKHIPYIANITGLGTAVENDGVMQTLTLALYRLSLRNAQNIFFQNSENMRFMLKKRICHGKYALIPGSGVNLQKYKLLEYPANDTLNFVYIARLMKEKGIEEYFEAAEYIHKKYPNTQFHICGYYEGDYEKRLLDLEQKGVVIYHGMVKDMTTIYSFTHCTILPTFYPEGMSNVLLESAASGKVVITTDRAGCREIVDDGVNGFIIRPKDSSDLINKIEKFISLSYEEQKAMGIAGRRKVEKEFDRNIVVRKYLEEMKYF